MMIYTLLGYFGMNPIMEGRNVMISQDFYRIDSDYPKDKYSRRSANTVLYQVILLWICTQTCQLYFYYIIFVAHIRYR